MYVILSVLVVPFCSHCYVSLSSSLNCWLHSNRTVKGIMHQHKIYTHIYRALHNKCKCKMKTNTRNERKCWFTFLSLFEQKDTKCESIRRTKPKCICTVFSTCILKHSTTFNEALTNWNQWRCFNGIVYTKSKCSSLKRWSRLGDLEPGTKCHPIRFKMSFVVKCCNFNYISSG